MGIGFEQQNPSRVAGDQFQKRLKQRVEDVVHTEVLREGKRRLAEGIGFGRRRFRESKVSRHLFLGGFAHGNVLCCTHQTPHDSSRVPHREAVNRNPANRAIGPNDAKLFIDLAGFARFFQARQDAHAVLGMKQFLIGSGIIAKRREGTARKRLVRWIDGEDVLRSRIEHPIDFLARAVERWEAVPLGLLQHLDLRTSMYGYIGIEDFTLYPIIRPGSLVQIDSAQRKISPAPWKTDFDRPIYFTELRDGYVCSWCEIERGRLIVIPHAHAHQEVRTFDYPAEAEIVGRVTAVAMRIVGDRSPEARRPPREK
jgi:hypothetical protein